MQLVLDTNVWIDWLVFNDPSIASLKAAHKHGHIHIVVNEACLEELNEVLGYPEFRLDDAQKKHHLAEVDRCTIRHDDPRQARPCALPRCSDPDDQKFLTLALDAAADWLLTRDKALLKIGQKKLEAAGFRIATPVQWTAALNQIPSSGAAI